MIATEAFSPRWVNEASVAYLKMSFLNKEKVLAAPAAITYAVQCMTTGTQIIAETSVASPADTVEITIPSSANAIINQANRYELRRVTVRTAFGDGQSHNEQFDYRVRNLSEVT